MTTTIKNYVVVLESSILFGEPISHSVEEFISEYKNNKKIHFLYIAPEMVLFEAENAMWNKYNELFNTFISSANNLTGLEMFGSTMLNPLKTKFRKQKEETKNFVVKKFKSLGIHILATPTDKIGWKEIIRNAAFRELPFEKGGREKGFKDMIIAQTLLINLPNLTKKGEVVFICNDGKLKEYVEERTKNIKQFRLFPSLLDFKSAIRLSEVTSGRKPIEEISEEAASAFYNEKNKESSLFIKEKVKEKIMEKYSSVIVNPPAGEDYNRSYPSLHSHTRYLDNNGVGWIPVSPLEYRVSNPIFVKKLNDLEYLWISTVRFSQTFEPRSYSVLAGNILHISNFRVTWKSIFSSDGSIDTNKSKLMGDIEYVRSNGWTSASLSPNYYSATPTTIYPSNLTSEGQGTVSIGSDITYPSPSPSPENKNEE